MSQQLQSKGPASQSQYTSMGEYEAINTTSVYRNKIGSGNLLYKASNRDWRQVSTQTFIHNNKYSYLIVWNDFTVIYRHKYRY